ncbi:MAG: hypothetical protein MJ016_06860, partial [Victivallaceae bacterium]|nr:hypothetical protein [Victivallaceae bacterium]
MSELKKDSVTPSIRVHVYPSSWTNGDVEVGAEFIGFGSMNLKYYSFDKQYWQPYEDSITVSKNRKIYFQAADSTGKVARKEYKVSNIDKVNPTISVKAGTTAWTNKNVKLTATFTDKQSGIEFKRYRLNGGDWKSYTGAISVSKNQEVYFEATDKAGNITTKTYEVKNIDKTKPTISIKAN